MAYLADITTPATGDAAMRRFKDQAVALGGWSVSASGDGRSAYGASSDVITADAGAGSLDASGAWYRLKMSGVAREYLVIRKATSDAWTIKYSVLGFSGGSPSATAAPTATDSQTLLDGTFLDADGTYRWVVCAEDAAPYYLGVDALVVGTLAVHTAWHLWPMRSGTYPAGDTDPYAVLAYYNSNASLVMRNDRLSNVSADVGIPKAWKTRATAAFVTCPFARLVSEVDIINLLGQNDVASDELPAEILATLVAGGPAYYGPKGYVRDARYCLSPDAVTPQGTYLTDGDSSHWLRVGDLWVRHSATAPTL